MNEAGMAQMVSGQDKGGGSTHLEDGMENFIVEG